MTVKQIFFFSVPWSETMDNLPLFTESDTTVSILSYMISHYSPKNVTFSDFKTFKSHGDDFTAQVDITQFDVNTNYNYACVRAKVGTIIKEIFYFIKDSETLYANATNGTANITFKYDPYLNNHSLLFSVPPQVVNRYTYNNITKIGDNKYNSHRYFGEQLEVKERTPADFYTESNKLRVCWARIWSDRPQYSSDKSITYKDFTCYPSLPSVSILMYPLYVLDMETLEIVSKNTTYYWNPTGIGADYKLNEIVLNNIDNILKVDTTFYPPFHYTVTSANKIAIYNIENNQILELYDENTNPYIFSKSLSTTALPLVALPRTNVEPHVQYMYAPTVSEPQGELEFSLAEFFPFCNEYPNKYYGLYINKEILPLIFYPDNNIYKLSVDPSGITPILTIECGSSVAMENPVYRSKPIPLNNNGTIPTAKSQYDIYQRSSGNQIIAQQNMIDYNRTTGIITGVLNVAAGATMALASGGVMGIGAGVKGVTNIGAAIGDAAISQNKLQATIADIQNAQDIYTIPSALANSDILQDIVVVREFTPKDYTLTKNLAILYNNYGYEYTGYVYLTKQTHTYFDYIRTQNCQLPNIKNARHRAAVENAFNRGTTLWHMYDCDGVFEKTMYNTVKE